MTAQTYAVTGVASGIGAELARLLKASGHRVIGFDIAERAAHVDRLIHLDLADEASLANAVGELDEPLDGLCNNAGLPPRAGMQEKILTVNYLAQRRLTKAILPKIRQGGSIVNMASRAGQHWRDGLDQVRQLTALHNATQLRDWIARQNIDPTRAYNLSKEAMIVWTMAESEAMLKRGLRINSVSPAAVSTAILHDFTRAFGDRVAKNIARTGRPGHPHEVAEVAAFLLSPQSFWIKGTDITVDGGMGAFAISDALGLDDLRLAD